MVDVISLFCFAVGILVGVLSSLMIFDFVNSRKKLKTESCANFLIDDLHNCLNDLDSLLKEMIENHKVIKYDFGSNETMENEVSKWTVQNY